MESEHRGPALLEDLGERFREEVGSVGMVWQVDYIDESLVDTVSNEMRMDVDMLHLGMSVRVVSADDGALVVTE